MSLGLPRWCSGKESACQYRRRKRYEFDPWVKKVLLEQKWQPHSSIFTWKFHGQKSLVDYSPGGHKLSDTTEHTRGTSPLLLGL